MLPKLLTKKLLIISFLGALIVAIFYGFIFSNIASKMERLSVLESDLEFELGKEERLKSIRQVLEDTKDERLNLDYYFVGKNNAVDFISGIEVLAGLSEVELEINRVAIDKSESDGTSFLETLTLELEASGNWDSMFHFTTLVEKVPYASSLKRVQLERAKRKVLGESDNGGGPSVWEGVYSLEVKKIR